jgi:hypothetical protein
MDPTDQRYNSYIGPLVSSDWNSPTVDFGYNFQVSEPVPGGLRHLAGVPEAMRAFDMVNFLFPV